MAALFHRELLDARIAQHAFPADVSERQALLRSWIARLRSGELAAANEVQLHGPFLQGVFGTVFGYRTWGSGDGQFDLHQEVPVRGGKVVDGAIGWFGGAEPRVHVPIELKGASQDLDTAGSRAQTPVEQAWGYANRAGGCRWIVVSNYRETRLYSTARSMEDFEVVRLADLADDTAFRRAWLLLSREAVLPGAPGGTTLLDELLAASAKRQEEVTGELYTRYSRIRRDLFQRLARAHSNLPPLEVLKLAQKLLDRVLFVAFAEDRELLPDGTLARALAHEDEYRPRPRWDNLKVVFGWIDRGNPRRNVPPYNGGLFAEDPDLDALDIDDATCALLGEFGAYDFSEDVSVEVLGHIFEQSIADLEELRAEVSGQAAGRSKRKSEGVFYTPAFVTRHIVEETLGRTLAEKFGELIAQLDPDGARGPKDRQAAWLDLWLRYREWLRTLRVLDPACGSGAFLVAAFERLHREYERVNASLAAIPGGPGRLFGLDKAILNQNLFGMDLNEESVEITKLSLWLKTAERNQKLTWLDGNIRWGNSVVSDPRVHARAVDWTGERPYFMHFEGHVEESEAAAVDARWREGFDVVIGNPPYVRQELLRAYKEHWKGRFRTYDGVADLFVYFFELGLSLLKPGGRLGFVASNKWLKSGYAGPLRELLATETEVETVIDFGHAPIFPDADAFPSIITLRRAVPGADRAVSVTRFPRKELGVVTVPEYARVHARPVPQARLGLQPWSLEDERVDRLMGKLRERGVALAEYAGCKPLYGIKTGFNEAFLVDDATRGRLIREHASSAEILHRFLRGANIDRWAPEWDGEWMIFARRGIDIDRFPAVLRHLQGLRAQLEPRPADYAGKDWPGRKPGHYAWYEIQDTVDYWEAFTRPKIVYQVIQFHSCYGLDEFGNFINDKGFAIPTADPWLLAVLNSPLLWWHNFRTLPHMKDEALAPLAVHMEALPVAAPSPAQRAVAGELVPRVVADVAANHRSRRAMLDALRTQYAIEKPGAALGAFHHLDADAFVHEVTRRRTKQAGTLRPSDIIELRGLHEAESLPMIRREQDVAAAERVLSDLVNAAYGLSAEELALVRETAPERMPPGFS